jgi:hypothetical protein
VTSRFGLIIHRLDVEIDLESRFGATDPTIASLAVRAIDEERRIASLQTPFGGHNIERNDGPQQYGISLPRDVPCR